MPTATPRPTPTPRPTYTPTPTPDPSAPSYGPIGGSIAHEPDDGFLEVFQGPSIAKSVMLEATFHNPYPISKGRWNYGFFLQEERVSFYHWVRIRSTGTWEHSYRHGTDKSLVTLRQESPSSIDTTPDGKNRMRLIVIGDEGWLYINGQFQGNLSLGAVDFDRVRLVVNEEVAGESTRFEGFAVWKWDSSLAALPTATATPAPISWVPYVPIHGPVSGNIVHDIQKPTNSFAIFRGPTIDEDIMVDVTFYNPYPISEGSWNYGFIRLGPEPNVYDWLYISSNEQWTRKVRFGDEEGDYTLAFGDSRIPNLDRTPGGKNKLRMVIVEGRAYIFINGRFQNDQNLTQLPDLPTIALVVNDKQEGVTRFEDFAVWKWHPSLQELPKPDDD